MDNIELYNMTIDDIPDIMEIEMLSFKTPWSRLSFVNEIEDNEAARYIIAKDGSRAIGYAGMWMIFDEGHITNIAVHPDYRGRGIGSLLVEALIELAREEDIAALTLEVRRTNYVAQQLYKKYGFESAGVRPKYYEDNGEDAIIMWKRDVQLI